MLITLLANKKIQHYTAAVEKEFNMSPHEPVHVTLFRKYFAIETVEMLSHVISFSHTMNNKFMTDSSTVQQQHFVILFKAAVA